MFSAATMTISPIASDTAIFSSHSALNSDWFMPSQSSVEVLASRARR